MRIRMRPLLFFVLALAMMRPVWAVEAPAADGRHAASASNWEEDLRRCLVRKYFDRGSMTLSVTNGSLEIYVRWSDGEGLEKIDVAKIHVEIDQDRFDLQPQKMGAGKGANTYLLSPYPKVASLVSKGKWLTLTFPGQSDRDLRLPIGNGKKAMGFLKKCEDYWKKWHQQHP